MIWYKNIWIIYNFSSSVTCQKKICQIKKEVGGAGDFFGVTFSILKVNPQRFMRGMWQENYRITFWLPYPSSERDLGVKMYKLNKIVVLADCGF